MTIQCADARYHATYLIEFLPFKGQQFIDKNAAEGPAITQQGAGST